MFKANRLYFDFPEYSPHLRLIVNSMAPVGILSLDNRYDPSAFTKASDATSNVQVGIDSLAIHLGSFRNAKDKHMSQRGQIQPANAGKGSH